MVVMPALVAGIHVLLPSRRQGADGRDKSGHDEDERLRHLTTAAVCPNNNLRSSSVRIAGWPKFGLISLASA